MDGTMLGCTLGRVEGWLEGVLGWDDGCTLGWLDGMLLGCTLGCIEGWLDGLLGCDDGCMDGTDEG
jgi:hypothetical protein